jgi:hypothetical protein
MSNEVMSKLLFLGTNLHNHIEVSVDDIPEEGEKVRITFSRRHVFNGFYRIISMDEVEFNGEKHTRISEVKRIKDSDCKKKKVVHLDFTKASPMGDAV